MVKKIGGVTGPKGSMPTTRGWIDPKTGHLLKGQRITQEQLDDYNGVQMIAEPFIPEVEEVTYEEPIEEEIIQKAPKKKKKSKRLGLFG